jgi:hypothetical protein
VCEIIGVVTRLGAAADLHGRPLTVDFVRAELGAPAVEPRPPRISAAVPAGDPFLDHERVVFDWPDAGARLVEEMR